MRIHKSYSLLVGRHGTLLTVLKNKRNLMTIFLMLFIVVKKHFRGVR